MPYTMVDAIRDEIKLLKELEAYMGKEKKTITEGIFHEQHLSYNRLLQRLENGREYNLVLRNGTPIIEYTKTNRKTLEEEYPALKNAAEKYDLIKNLVDSTPKSDE